MDTNRHEYCTASLSDVNLDNHGLRGWYELGSARALVIASFIFTSRFRPQVARDHSGQANRPELGKRPRRNPQNLSFL